MLYLFLGLTGLLIIVALFTYLNRHRQDQIPPLQAPEEGCCGAHAVCEKGLKKIDTHIDYFDDEELDLFKNTAPDAYSDGQIEQFRDILYTLRKEEIDDWLISLEKRNICFPEALRAEAIDLLNG